MAEQDRDFKGVWIPKVVWLDERLNALDKVILTEIDSLDNGERGCWASNKHIADFCQCSESKVSTAISRLIKYGYLYVQKFDGRQRELKSRLSNFERQASNFCKADAQDLKESNTDTNTLNNTSSKKVSKKEPLKSFDELIDEYTENAELRGALRDYIQMRTAIRKKMTNRALELAFKELDKLAASDWEKIAIVNQSVLNSWQGLFPLKDQGAGRRMNNGANNGGNASQDSESIARRIGTYL